MEVRVARTFLETLIHGTMLPDDEIRPEAVEHFYDKLAAVMPLLAIANSFNAIAMAFVFRESAPAWLVWGWLAPLLVFAAMQFRTARRMKGRDRSKTPSGRFLKKAEFRTFLFGVWWSLSCIIFASGSDVHALALAGASLGMCAASTATVGPVTGVASRFTLGAYPVALLSMVWGDNVATMVVMFLGSSLVLTLLYMSHLKYNDTLSMLRSNRTATKAHRRLLSAVNAIGDPFVILDEDGGEILANDEHQRVFEQAPHERSNSDGSVSIGGSFYQKSVSETPDGDQVRLYTDITRLKKQQAELIEARSRAELAAEAKSRFLSTMSHEFLTPLNSVIGFSDLLRPGSQIAFDRAAVEEYAQRINASGRELHALVESVMEYSKLEAGFHEVVVEPLEMAKAVTEAVDRAIASAGAPHRREDISVSIAPKMKFVAIDHASLLRILTNLIVNAIVYSDDGAPITVKAGMTPQSVPFVMVRDAGVGMADDEIEQAFEPFVQLESHLTRRWNGPGLGLSICRRLAKQCDGDVVLESGRGAGTRAFFVMNRQAALADDELEKISSANSGDFRRQILVEN